MCLAFHPPKGTRISGLRGSQPVRMQAPVARLNVAVTYNGRRAVTPLHPRICSLYTAALHQQFPADIGHCRAPPPAGDGKVAQLYLRCRV